MDRFVSERGADARLTLGGWAGVGALTLAGYAAAFAFYGVVAYFAARAKR
jgi:hypothetical protein